MIIRAVVGNNGRDIIIDLEMKLIHIFFNYRRVAPPSEIDKVLNKFNNPKQSACFSSLAYLFTPASLSKSPQFSHVFALNVSFKIKKIKLSSLTDSIPTKNCC